MEANTIYIIFGLVLIITAILFYLLGSKSSKRLSIDLEIANKEAKTKTIELEETTSELLELKSISEKQSIKVAKYENIITIQRSNYQKTLSELKDTKERLNSFREDFSHEKEIVARLGADLKSTTKSLEESKLLYKTIQTELKERNSRNSLLQSENSKTNANLVAANNELSEKKSMLDDLNSKYFSLESGNNVTLQENIEIKTKMQTKQKHYDEQIQLIQDNKNQLKKEFENLSNEILDKKGKALKEINLESINNILTPIHQELKRFKTKVEDIHGKDTAQRAELTFELKNLQGLNKEITDQANKLTTALKGNKKVQGNWGELMLENILDNSGLILGKDYKREVSLDREEGGESRPDAIIYLPQNKHIVIDAKTSLNAYTEYVNAEEDNERQIALKKHTMAVKDRLNELSNKDYFKLLGINSPEVVVMFIPIESAYIEALKADESLFQHALDQNILIATPTTLLTSLNIVKQLWRFEEQNKHTAELASRAEKFYNKLNSFLISMGIIGKQLDKAKETYDKACGQLYGGKANLIKQASEFKDLGVSVKKELPVEFVDKANLELGEEQIKLVFIDEVGNSDTI